MELLGRQFFAFVINLHLVRQGIGNVKLRFLTGLFKSNCKLPRRTGDPRDHGLGFDRDAGIIFQFFDFRVQGRLNQAVIGVSARQLFTPIFSIAAQDGFFFNDRNFIAGFGGIDGR